MLVLGLLLWGGWSLWQGQPSTRARRAYGRGDWREASSAARDVLEGEPDRGDMLNLLARAEARQGHAQTARTIYQRLDPRDLQGEDYLLVGRGLIAEGRVEEGRYGLGRALGLHPGYPEALLELIRLDRRIDRLAEAGARAVDLAASPGWEARALVPLGLVRLGQGDPSSAAESFRSALSRDPKLVGVEEGSPDDVRKFLARSLLRIGQPVQARTYLGQILGTRPDDVEANHLLSRAFLQEHDPAGAKEALDRAGDYGADHIEAPEPSPYVGVARCKECHPAIFRAQRSSRHAQTFRARDDLKDLPLPARSKADPADPAIVHGLTRDDRGVVFRTSTPGGDREALVEFVMGSGDRAMTLVGRDSERAWRELRLSYYDSIHDWDRTPGQPVRPRSHQEFLGQIQNEDAVRRCLSCHTTYSRVVGDRVEVSPERGFSCERCHGPAGNHLDAIALKFPDPAIARPRLAPVGRVNALCGQCHGAAGRGLTADDPDLARFQASALPLSRCATAGGQPTMSCLSCHDPHRNSETSPAFYEAKCLKCHGSASDDGHSFGEHGLPRMDAIPGARRKVACPVNPSQGCVSCHMPKVQTSVPHTKFTDHFIRVRPNKPDRQHGS